MDTLIKNVRIIDKDKDFLGELYTSNGKIIGYGKNLRLDLNKLNRVIDGNGNILMPSFVDMHCHFRDPGYTYKEDLKSGSLAALKGGYTYVNLMANTKPVVSSKEILEDILNRNKSHNLIGIHQVMSITKDFNGNDFSHLKDLPDYVKILSDDGVGIVSNYSMYKALEIGKLKDKIIMVHPEDSEISKIDSRLSENIMTFRDIELAKKINAKLHIAHISTKEIVEYVRNAKKQCKNITCEVTPHHISLYGNDYKVSPMIRTKEDVESLKLGIKDGTIDMIATDHAPHSKSDKDNGAPGISGLETSFMVSYTELVKKGYISMKELSRVMSYNPAKLLGLNIGSIKKGNYADLVLVNVNKENEIDSSKFVSKGKNTPFDGMSYYGEILFTMRKGKIMYSKARESNDR